MAYTKCPEPALHLQKACGTMSGGGKCECLSSGHYVFVDVLTAETKPCRDCKSTAGSNAGFNGSKLVLQTLFGSGTW